MSSLKIAVQKSGRLFEDSIKLLKDCGISYDNGKDQLKVQIENFPIELFFLRNSDIPQYVEDGVVDVAIVGENLLIEKQKDIEIVQKLGFLNVEFLWQFLKILKPMIYNIFKVKKLPLLIPIPLKLFPKTILKQKFT
jgi:ATP phosphoribosyltransferase